jgi:hypothetical protein
LIQIDGSKPFTVIQTVNHRPRGPVECDTGTDCCSALIDRLVLHLSSNSSSCFRSGVPLYLCLFECVVRAHAHKLSSVLKYPSSLSNPHQWTVCHRTQLPSCCNSTSCVRRGRGTFAYRLGRLTAHPFQLWRVCLVCFCDCWLTSK